MKTKSVTLIPITGMPLVQSGDDLVEIILERLRVSENPLASDDIIVLSQKIVSKAEGAKVDLKSCTPSQKAVKLARSCGKDVRIVELILRESKKILRQRHNLLITEHKSGCICANAGIDYSNVADECVTLLPENSDQTAQQIRLRIRKLTDVDIAVIIIDSQGRPFREGTIGVALGSSGISPLVDKTGSKDLFGYELKHTRIALIDELASAALLLMGETDEGIPAVILRGLSYPKGPGKASDLIRPEASDLFR